MKLNFIVDKDGVIVGTAPANPKAEGKDAPSSVAIESAAGRAIHKLDAPKELAGPGTADAFRRFRVSLRGQPKVVQVRERAVAAPAAPAAALPTSPKAPKRKPA